eukprot:6634373-Prymnesium_polylepis.1
MLAAPHHQGPRRAVGAPDVHRRLAQLVGPVVDAAGEGAVQPQEVAEVDDDESRQVPHGVPVAMRLERLVRELRLFLAAAAHAGPTGDWKRGVERRRLARQRLGNLFVVVRKARGRTIPSKKNFPKQIHAAIKRLCAPILIRTRV